jgi:hypothetical protein
MSEKVTFCYNCGAKIEAEENFCRQCGRRSGQLTEQPLADAARNMLRQDAATHRNQYTSDYGQGATQTDPPSSLTNLDADIDPTPTLYSPGPNTYSQNPSSFYGQASGSYSQETGSHGDSKGSSTPGAASYSLLFDSYPPSGGPQPSQQVSQRSNKQLVGLIIGLLLLTVIGILLGLWLSDAI